MTTRRQAFSEHGYLPPVRVFGARECETILAGLTAAQRPPMDWEKGWGATSPEYFRLAVHDDILGLVTDLLGDDVVLWGASLVRRKPGEAHPWHTDIESSSAEGETLAVWIGLANTNPLSSLKVAPFSHRFGAPLQQVAQQKGAGREKLTDELVAGWARERDARSGVVPVKARDGDVVLFDGRLWHGSQNLNESGPRYAALLQYATPRTPIRIPDLSRLEWPFESYRAPLAPCVLVSGHAVDGHTRLVAGPAVSGSRWTPALTTRVHSLQLPLEQDPEVGWKPHPQFRGATPNLKTIGCHASVLDPGRQPHPPHRHDEEEILVVLDGEATLVLEEGHDTARRGTFAYYPASFAHTIRNEADAPVTYVMLKWQTDPREKAGLLEHRLVPYGESSDGTEPSGFSASTLLEGETTCLRRLHSHLTTLQPGAGYDPHVDAHDVAIVVLEGTLETLGERVGPNSVVFYAAGEPHGMRNVGDAPAVYLVFEFHGRHLPHRSPNEGPTRPGTRLRSFLRRAVRIARSPREAARSRSR
jgi:quercetin dioxygenase-like cupin family protein